jgi:sulfite oxidase
VILHPAAGASQPAGATDVSGWALAPEGRTVARVELSVDGGREWQPAGLQPVDRNGWAWCPWRATVRLAPGRHELVVRAFDNGGGTQPASVREVWNAKGYANNAWHRVALDVT